MTIDATTPTIADAAYDIYVDDNDGTTHPGALIFALLDGESDHDAAQRAIDWCEAHNHIALDYASFYDGCLVGRVICVPVIDPANDRNPRLVTTRGDGATVETATTAAALILGQV